MFREISFKKGWFVRFNIGYGLCEFCGISVFFMLIYMLFWMILVIDDFGLGILNCMWEGE